MKLIEGKRDDDAISEENQTETLAVNRSQCKISLFLGCIEYNLSTVLLAERRRTGSVILHTPRRCKLGRRKGSKGPRKGADEEGAPAERGGD